MLDQIRPSDLKRFWSKVNLTPTDTGCIEWKSEHATAKGYGVMRWKNDRMTQATRIAWEIFWGVEPSEDLLHSCDNRPCVNVLHLREGTDTENVIDMHDRNPNSRADLAHGRRLTYEQVDEIRRRYRTGRWSADQLAAEYGVTQTVISNAASGRSYTRGPVELPVPALGRGRRSQKVG